MDPPTGKCVKKISVERVKKEKLFDESRIYSGRGVFFF